MNNVLQRYLGFSTINNRYGSPGNVSKEYNEFADVFLKAFAVGAQQVGNSPLHPMLDWKIIAFFPFSKD